MATVGEIAIVVGADVGPMVRELGKGKGALNDFGNSGSKMGGIIGSAMGKAAIGVGLAATALTALTKSSMNNIDVLSKQARALGISVSSFQAMAMVAGEAGVESDKLSKILIKMQDNIASLGDGTAAQVDQFTALGLSMSDLMGLGADEQFKLIAERINGITDPAKKTAAALNVFGKSGADAITMLDGYGAALDNAAQFQRDFGIAVSDVDAQQIEAANDAMGRMGMAAEGLGNVLAVALAPAVEETANMFAHLMREMQGAQDTGIAFFQNMENYRAVMEKFGSTEAAAALAGGWQNLEAILAESNAIETLEAMAYSYDSLQDTAGRATSNMAGDIQALADEYPVLSEALASMSSEVDRLSVALQEALDAGDVEAAQQYSAELGVAVDNLNKAVTAADALSSLDLSGAVSAAGALATAFGNVASMARAAVAAASGMGGMTTGSGLTGADGNMPPTFDSGMPSSPRPESAPNDIDFGLGDGGGGGGGGGSNPMTARIEALVESLKTESEIVATWYEESLAALNAATEAELEALGGKHEAIERLEEEHQNRLKGIKEAAAESGLSLALGAGETILSAMGQTNKKALKVAKVFGAAQALISTYQGAAEALKLPFPGNMAAVASIIAKGMGLVAAIRSTSESGGGGSGGRGGSAGAAAAAPQAPVQTMNLTFQNDPWGIKESFARQLIGQMNAASRNGMLINATVTST
jgi:hypothetical protein